MLSRRMLINFVLVVLIIVFTYIGNRYDVQTGYQEKPPVSQLKPAQIQNIELQTADWSIALTRQTNGWAIESPIRWPASNLAVERLLDIVNSKTDSSLDASEADLDQFGLRIPRAILRLDGIQLLFGATNNIGERRYTMIDSTVYLLPDIHLPLVSQGLVSLVDRRLLPRRFELNRLALPGLDMRLDSSGAWKIDGRENIDSARLEQLVKNWQGLEAARIKAYDSQQIPRQKIQAEFSDGANIEFFVMSIEPEIILANPDIDLQYHFRTDLYYQLIALPADENPA